MKKILVPVVIVLIIAALVLWKEQNGKSKSSARGKREVPVTVLRVEKQPFSVRTRALGTLFARESVDITANVSEKVARVHFEEGQWVKRGDILVTLEQDEERAQLAQAKTNLAEQKRETKRLEELVKKRSIPQNELDARRTQLETAKQRIQEVEASVKDRTLKAPFDGLLGLRRVSPGALVSPGTLIVTLDDVSTMKLDFSVPATYLTALREKMLIEAKASALGDQIFNGAVVTIDSRVDPVNRSIQVRAHLPNDDSRLKPGLLMEVELIKERVMSVVLPEASVIGLQDRHFALIVDEAKENTVSRRDITIGGREYGRVQVLEGVEPGELIVTEGVSMVRPGSKVKIKSIQNGTDKE